MHLYISKEDSNIGLEQRTQIIERAVIYITCEI